MQMDKRAEILRGNTWREWSCQSGSPRLDAQNALGIRKHPGLLVSTLVIEGPLRASNEIAQSFYTAVTVYTTVEIFALHSPGALFRSTAKNSLLPNGVP